MPMVIIVEFRNQVPNSSFPATDDASDLTVAFFEIKLVNVTFLVGCFVRISNTYPSFFCLGNPISLIRKSAVPTRLISENVYVSGFAGLNNSVLVCTLGEILIEIEFKKINKTYEDLCCTRPLHFVLHFDQQFLPMLR